ncbi:MAG: MBL fold metallo-hydrolase [Deltaproteobacteria bacterium]|nr:MBL fold metallo-hydrolase [Deltaproteobacteria bacterium]
MNEEKIQIIDRQHEDPFKIVTEHLGEGDADLKSFYFRRGANFYAFSYGVNGARRHTLIDTGDSRYGDRILSILTENAINPANIERIIITHRHYDHCGLAELLGGPSGAEIVAHENFRSFVEGKIGPEEYRWMRGFKPGRLKRCNMAYLHVAGDEATTTIGGVEFPRPAEPFKIGGAGDLSVLACPACPSTHSPDQLIALYSPAARPQSPGNKDGRHRMTDDIIFSGDLWLMHGPIFERYMLSFHQRLVFSYLWLKTRISGKGASHRDPREQDAVAKMALKLGFCLIRVKPGHGEEFLGARIIPSGLLAKRDILLALGYSINADKSILKNDNLASRVQEMLENAHAGFVGELRLWMEHGYSADEISRLLLRIYLEQSGGGYLVKEDRKERRKKMLQTLMRLRDEENAMPSLRQIAASTLTKLPR